MITKIIIQFVMMKVNVKKMLVILMIKQIIHKDVKNIKKKMI